MSFFEALPDPAAEPEPAEEEPEWVVPEWLGPSKHVAGGLVPFRAPFVHDHRLCIRLDRVEAFPTGLLLQLELHMVDEVSGGRYVSGLFPWAVIDRSDPGRLLHRDYRVAPDDLLRFGVQYRGGRSVATRSIHEFQHQHGELAGAEQPPDNPVLVAGQGGRGGGGRRASMSLWVWPLPPIGEDLVLLVQWPVFGIQQASVTIPGAEKQSPRRAARQREQFRARWLCRSRAALGECSMSVRGFLSHLDLNVTDPGRSIVFYGLVLGELGYERHDIGPDRASWSLTMAGGGVFAIEVRPPRNTAPRERHERYAPGIDHLAFHAASRAEVDRMAEVLGKVGHPVADAPAEYDYTPGYYAVAFDDPDGIRLEVVHEPSSNP